MKKHIKQIFILQIIIIIMLIQCGCWNMRELDSLSIVMGFGIDKAEVSDEIELTAQIVKTGGKNQSSANEKGSDDSSFINLRSTGNDIFTIIREYTHKISRRLYIGDSQIIVFGESSAKEGIRNKLDFFMRDHEGRLIVYVIVAKGKAYDVLKEEPEFGNIPAIDIANLIENQFATSEAVKVTLFDLIPNLVNNTKSMVLPCVSVLSEGEGKKIALTSSAVFKDDKLVGELDKKETRGYLWVMNDVKSGVINVNVLGENTSIEIKKAKSEVVPQINKDGSIKIKVKITEEGILNSQVGNASLDKVFNNKKLENATAYVIKKEIQKTLDKAREMGTDIYGFGEDINRKYPKEWKTIKANWDKLFKEIDINIEVISKLRGEGRIVNPIYPEKEESK